MAPKKLSDADRQDILQRYRQPEENTVTIANSYGVSTSTISRILKQNLSEEEYESLIQQKRSGTHKTSVEEVNLPGAKPQMESAVSLVPETVNHESDQSKPAIPLPRRRQRRRSSDPSTFEEFASESQPSQLELTAIVNGKEDYGKKDYGKKDYELTDESRSESFVDAVPVPERTELEEIEAELGKVSLDTTAAIDEDLDEDLDEDDEELDEDLEDEDLDDEDFEDEELTSAGEFTAVQIQRGGFVQVLPLSEATIPRTCYVVVDRSSELITRPLKDFADLGQIPEAEIQEKTLPVFDNHRIAKRFTRRMQRVVKVPDGRMFQKVRPYLQSKGITRLLIDGQVYSL